MSATEAILKVISATSKMILATKEDYKTAIGHWKKWKKATLNVVLSTTKSDLRHWRSDHNHRHFKSDLSHKKLLLATEDVITATLKAISATTKANDSPVWLLEVTSKDLLNIQAISLGLVALRPSWQFVLLYYRIFFVGGARALLTLLSCSEQRFGTKSDVTPFIKPAYRSISFIIWAFPGVASNIPDTIQSNFTRFHILLYGLFKWSLIIHSSLFGIFGYLWEAGWSWILISLGEWGQHRYSLTQLCSLTSPQPQQTRGGALIQWWPLLKMLCQHINSTRSISCQHIFLLRSSPVTEYIPSNYDALTRCGYNVRPMSQTMGEH